jgi:hypothetical protein
MKCVMYLVHLVQDAAFPCATPQKENPLCDERNL